MSLSRTFRTVRHLRPSQVAYMMFYRVLGRRRRPTVDSHQVRRREKVTMRPRPCLSPPGQWPSSFSFVGQTIDFPNGIVDWDCPEAPALWRYNLHYFDYILDETRSIADRDHLIHEWVARNPLANTDAWAPYPISLRIVNWIDYLFRTESKRPIPQEWLESLYLQALWLEKTVEYHILANHLMKNAVALFFAGAFFSGNDADRWLALGRRLLDQEIEEQILDDGGHYEKSPMYHAIITQDMLDVSNLIFASGDVFPENLLKKMKSVSLSCLGFLEDIVHPDGDVPLFNDSALAIAPSLMDLKIYSEEIFDHDDAKGKNSEEECKIIDKAHSGYYGFRNNGDYLLMDCGTVGPNYQPGHAHCDLLSYELSMDGRRVVVDSGVFGYANDELRAYVRSTAAHNTVRIDNEEQSEMWSAFRVGRRAEPLSAEIHRKANGGFVFEGSHDGYTHLPQRVIHARTISHEKAPRRYVVTDRLSGTGDVRGESFLHLHPDLRVERENSHLYVFASDDALVMTVEACPSLEVSITEGSYCPRFGQRQANTVVVFEKRAALPFDMSYVLSKPAQ